MPRLPYLEPTAASPAVVEALSGLPRQLNVFRMIANAQTAFRPWLRYGAALLTELELDPALRELAILEVARLSGSRYEWVQHHAIALAVGVTEEQIDAIEHERAEALDAAARAVVAFTADVVRNVRAGDETLAAVEAVLSPREVVELLLVIGQYMTVARVAETAGIEVDEPLGALLTDAARTDGRQA